MLVTKVFGPTFKDLHFTELKNVPYSLILDESTDVARKKEMAVVARYFSHKSSKFSAAFLCIILYFDASSRGLFSYWNFLENNNLALADCWCRSSWCKHVV